MTNWLDEPGRQVADEHKRLDGTRIGKATALSKVLLLDYRCPKTCLLLHVWQSPSGRLFYLPGYQLSRPKADAETAMAAREYRTTDGDRSWPARGGNLDDLLHMFERTGTPIGLQLTCRHVRRVITAADLVDLLDGSRPGRPTRRTLSHD